MSERLSLMPWDLWESFSPRKNLALKNTVRLAEVMQDGPRQDKFPQFGIWYVRRKKPFDSLQNRAGCRENSFRVVQQRNLHLAAIDAS